MIRRSRRRSPTSRGSTFCGRACRPMGASADGRRRPTCAGWTTRCSPSSRGRGSAARRAHRRSRPVRESRCGGVHRGRRGRRRPALRRTRRSRTSTPHRSSSGWPGSPPAARCGAPSPSGVSSTLAARRAAYRELGPPRPSRAGRRERLRSGYGLTAQEPRLPSMTRRHAGGVFGIADMGPCAYTFAAFRIGGRGNHGWKP